MKINQFWYKYIFNDIVNWRNIIAFDIIRTMIIRYRAIVDFINAINHFTCWSIDTNVAD